MISFITNIIYQIIARTLWQPHPAVSAGVIAKVWFSPPPSGICDEVFGFYLPLVGESPHPHPVLAGPGGVEFHHQVHKRDCGEAWSGGNSDKNFWTSGPSSHYFLVPPGHGDVVIWLSAPQRAAPGRVCPGMRGAHRTARRLPSTASCFGVPTL